MIKKPILVLEDTGHIVDAYVRAIRKAGYEARVHHACDMDYDLRDFDGVFVDRDNALASEGKPDEFHTYFLSLFSNTLKKKRPYEPWRIFPASNESLNNNYLVDSITRAMEKRGYISDHDSREAFRVDILRNFIRKSTLRDGAEFFEKEVSRHLANLERRKSEEVMKAEKKKTKK